MVQVGNIKGSRWCKVCINKKDCYTINMKGTFKPVFKIKKLTVDCHSFIQKEIIK